METPEKKGMGHKSIAAFDERYFPRWSKRRAVRIMDVEDLATSLAEEALGKAKRKLDR